MTKKANSRPEPREPVWPRDWTPLLAYGLLLETLLLGLFVVVGYLNWYPSRLGPISEWLDDHLVGLAEPLLAPGLRPFDLLPVILYFLLLLGIFAGYLLALRWAFRLGAGGRSLFGLILAFSLLFHLSLLLQPYLLSQDIFSYAYYARIFAHYGGNPYVAVPRDYPFDPLFEAIFWRDQPSNYGPLWTYATGLLSLLTLGNTASTILSFKLLSLSFAIAGVPFVWLILGRLSRQARVAGTLLYAWNPLLIVETSGSGHNDIVMAFFLLPAIYLYLRGARLSGLVMLVLSILFKYVTIVLVPVYLALWLREENGWRQRLQALASGGIVSLVLLAAAYWPVYAGPSTIPVASFVSKPVAYVNSPPELLFREVRVLLGEPPELASLPLRFRGWWVSNRDESVLLWSLPGDPQASAIKLPASSSLLVVEPQAGPWLHVYEPRLDRFGFVRADEVQATASPSSTGDEGITAAVLRGADDDPVAQKANLVVRLGLGALFLLSMALIVWRTRSLEDMLIGWLASLVLSYWLVQTWFWPWYLLWSLVPAALAPHSRLSSLVVVFSVLSLSLYGQIDAAGSSFLASVYQFRSLALFGTPILLAIAWWLYQSGRLRLLSVSRAHLRPLSFACLLLIAVAAGLAGNQISAGSPLTQRVGLQNLSPYGPAAWAGHYWRGVGYFESGQYEAAVEELSQALRLRPGWHDAYKWRYLANLRLQRVDEAISDIQALISIDGERYEWLLARGSAYVEKQRYYAALSDFDRAIALEPDSGQAYRLRALTHAALGETDQAIADQWKAVALSPNRASLYRELGQMYASVGQFDRALQLYDYAISLDDTDVTAFVGRAAVLRQLGRTAETISDLRKVMVLSNDEDERSWAAKGIAASQSRRIPPRHPQ